MNVTLPNSNLQLGSWLQTGSPVIAELADASGFDWLLIDLEHGCGTEANVLPQIQVIRHAAAIVRVGAPHPELIARSLDWGAAGIMVPMVSTPEKAEACVRAMRYPPRGDRGLARMVRAFQYGLQSEMPTPVFYAQIETIEGVENARCHRRRGWCGCAFHRPHGSETPASILPRTHPIDFAACLREVAAAAKAAGKACGMLCRQTDDFAELQALGFTHLAIETDITLLRESYRNVIQPLRAETV
jgi:2-keto-3-deoxy-L-rhamnonate aldolase RhmA